MRGKLPECRNPGHPSPNRATMICAEERDDCFIFYCKLCADLKVQSVQVRTKANLRNQTRRDLMKRNQLLQAPAPRLRQHPEVMERYEFEMKKKSRR
jgi:hypothetical protein